MALLFTHDGVLYIDITDRLVDFYLSCSIHYLTILGVMGKTRNLARDKMLGFAKRVLNRIDGRISVIASSPYPGLKALRKLVNCVTGEGVAVVMAAPEPNLKGDNSTPPRAVIDNNRT